MDSADGDQFCQPGHVADPDWHHPAQCRNDCGPGQYSGRSTGKFDANANNSYSTAATDKWSTFANSLAQAEKIYLNAVAAATGTNAATAITAAQKVRHDARSLALKDFQTGLLDSAVILNSAITGAIQTFVTAQSAAAAQESQGKATAQKTHNQADTTAEIGLTSALVTAGNAAATALSGASGAFSLATSGAQSAWKIAAAVANGISNPDGATRVFNDKLTEFIADQQATNNPLTAAAGFVSTMVTAVANAESAAATASGNALTTAVNTIGTADVTAVTATTNADSAYSTASVGNDKTYLDGMATAEANYLKVVAEKWHDFRTGAITAAQRDEAIATSWTEFQNAAAQKRNTSRIAQAEDAATFRNTVAGAAKTHIDAVTAAQETLTNSLQNGQKTLTQQKADAWLTASKGLVNLDTESTIQRAQGLAAAIGELAGEDRVHVDNGQSGYEIDNPFWVALSQKANQSAEYMADMKNAERLYYGRSPWSETVNGAVIDHMNGTRGVMDARRDFEVGMADAAATQNKALQQAGGTRDRELADAGLQLAQARSTYETDWANLNLESSNWKLDQPTLPITGDVDGTISLTAGVGTTFVPGWFSVPRLSEAEISATTATGFSSLDLDYFFTGGLMPDMPESDPVTTGKVSRDDSQFGAALIQPSGQDGNETLTPAPQDGQITVEVEDNVAYDPPAPFPWWVLGVGRIPRVFGGGLELLGRPTAPGQFDKLLPGDWAMNIDPALTGADRFKGTPFDRALWGGPDWPTSTVDNDAHLDGRGTARGRRPLLTPETNDAYDALEDDLAFMDLLSASGAFGEGFAKGFFSDGFGGLWDTIKAIPGFIADASDYTSSSLAYSWHWLWGNQESADNTRAGTFWKEAGDALNNLLDMFCLFSSHELESVLEFGDYRKVFANVQS
jgi:hypothetical protein